MKMNARRIPIVFAVIASLLLGAFVAAAAEEGALKQPSALFPETEYAFPSVVEGARVKHDFVIRNTGTAELQVHQVRTG